MRPSSARALAVCALVSLFAAVGLSHIVPPILALTNGGSITALGVSLTENFDSLASAGSKQLPVRRIRWSCRGRYLRRSNRKAAALTASSGCWFSSTH